MRPLACPRCNGKGKSVTFREREHIYMSWYIWQECPACQGTGYRLSKLDAPKNSFAPLTEPLVAFTTCLGTKRLPDATPAKRVLAATIKL